MIGRRPKSCACEICQHMRAFEIHMQEITNPEAAEFFKALYNRFIDSEFDLDYYKAIFNGSWPDAEEILQQALDKIRGGHEATI